MKAVLLYQAGIANVFKVDSFNLSDYGRDAERLIQGSFGQCETFARGLVAAGATVTTAHANVAGDASRVKWSDDISEAPFRESFSPVYSLDVLQPA